jgi:uncharacterized protein YndB with AHSA1/START domain
MPEPTGRLLAGGRELHVTRRFDAPIDDVWASVTEPERTARWFAEWHGDARPGATIRYRLVFEPGHEESDMLVEACTPPTRLVVSTTDEGGTWRIELRLAEADGVTTLTLVHHLEPDAPIGEVGPGWEYYLDMLVASREGTALRDFDDYYPSQRSWFLDQRPD